MSDVHWTHSSCKQRLAQGVCGLVEPHLVAEQRRKVFGNIIGRIPYLPFHMFSADCKFDQVVRLHASCILFDDCCPWRWVLGLDDGKHVASDTCFWVRHRANCESAVCITADLRETDCWTGYSDWALEPCEAVEDEVRLNCMFVT